MKIIDTYHVFAKEIFLENEDDQYVSIGFGRFKRKGKEDDESADVFVKTDAGKYVKSDKDKGGDKAGDSGDGKPKDSDLSGSDFERGSSSGEDDNAESDDVEISDANSGPIDLDDIMDMLTNDKEIMDKLGDNSDVYWDGLDLVSSKFDDATVASIDDDSNMTLGDLKQQILDFEPEDDEDEEDEEKDESFKVINGVKYRPLKESKEKDFTKLLNENYKRFSRK